MIFKDNVSLFFLLSVRLWCTSITLYGIYVNKILFHLYLAYILFSCLSTRENPPHEMKTTNLPSSHRMKITNLSFTHQMKMTNFLSFCQMKMTNFPSSCQLKMTNFPFFPSENDQSNFPLPVRCKRPSFPADANDQLSLFLSDVNDPTFQIK